MLDGEGGGKRSAFVVVWKSEDGDMDGDTRLDDNGWVDDNRARRVGTAQGELSVRRITGRRRRTTAGSRQAITST